MAAPTPQQKYRDKLFPVSSLILKIRLAYLSSPCLELGTCPTADQLIYQPFDCKDGFSDNGVYNDPINSILPIKIAYYENDYSVYVAYDIIAQVRDDKLTVIINDKTGGNRQAALDQLKEKGINPNDYTIVYNDLSAEQTPSRAPDDANI